MSTHRLLWAGCSVIALVLPGETPRLRGVGDEPRPGSPVARTESEAEILEAMDSKLMTDCLEAARFLAEWRGEFNQIRTMIEEGREAAGEASDLSKGAGKDPLAVWIEKVSGFLQKRSPKFLELLHFKDKAGKLEQQLKEARDEARKAAFDEEKWSFLTRATFEKMLLEELEGEYRWELAQVYHDEIFKRIEELKNPADLTNRLLEELIKAQVLQKPVVWNGLKCQIKNLNPKDFKTSLFKKDPGLELEVSYTAGIKATVSGLYFDRNLKPVLKDIKVKTDIKGILSKAAGDLTNKIFAGLELPLTVTDIEPVRFGDGPDRGAIRMTVTFRLSSFLKGLEASARLILTTEETPQIKFDGKIGFNVGITTVPIGNTGLAFRGIGGSIDPKNKTAELKTIISTVAGDPRQFGLDVTVTFGVPLKEIKMTGTLLVLSQPVGKIEGWINEREVAGTLNIPSPDGNTPLPIGEVLKVKADFKLDKTGLTADSMTSLFKAYEESMKLILSFSGDGSLELKKGYKLLGVDASGSLTASFTPGFKKLHLDAVVSIEVDLPLRMINASVAVEANADPAPRVVARARALGVTVEVEAKDLNELPDKIKDAILKQLPQMFDNLLFALAELGDQGSRLLAKAEEDLRNEVSAAAKRYGLDAIRTGNPTFDKTMGEVAKGGKKVIEAGVKARERASQWLSDVAKNPAGTVEGTVKSTLRDLSGLLPWERKKREAEQEEKLAEARKKDREWRDREKKSERLLPLTKAINKLLIEKAQTPGAGARTGTVTAVRVQFEKAVCAPADPNKKGGEKDAVVGFLLLANGYQKARAGGVGTHDSSVVSGYIRFVNLLAKDKGARPRAQINLPDFKHGSALPARKMAWDALANLIEELLPDVDIEGRQHERRLLIRNTRDETAWVWVQTYSRGFVEEEGYRWFWRPDDPGTAHDAVLFIIPPRKSLLLHRNKAIRNGKKFRDERTSDKTSLFAPEPGEVRGRSARLWAEWDSGVVSRLYINKPLWLVPETDEKGRHYYDAAEMETFTHDLASEPGPHTFYDRDVRVCNNTKIPLTVEARVWAHDAGKSWEWRSSDNVLLKPGTEAWLKQRHAARRLHGSDIRFRAADEHKSYFRWVKYGEKSLPLVEEKGYRAEKREVALLLLEPPDKGGAGARVKPPEKGSWTRHLPADEVWVPALKGKSLRTALADLTARSLRASYDQKTPMQLRVLGQSPEKGWRPPQTAVRLTFGIPVPLVEGMKLAAARAELEKRGLRATSVQTARPPITYYPDDRVRHQEPSASTDANPVYVLPGTAVKLTVDVKVPRVTEMTLSRARQELEKRNLKAEPGRLPHQRTKVVGQVPRANTYAAQGTIVRLDVHLPVPDVATRHLPMAEAERLVKAAGFEPKAQKSLHHDRVCSQQPPGGTWAAPGKIVTLVPGATVPDMKGWDLKRAQAELKRVGFGYKVRDTRPAPTDDTHLIGAVRVRWNSDIFHPHYPSSVSLYPWQRAG